MRRVLGNVRHKAPVCAERGVLRESKQYRVASVRGEPWRGACPDCRHDGTLPQGPRNRDTHWRSAGRKNCPGKGLLFPAEHHNGSEQWEQSATTGASRTPHHTLSLPFAGLGEKEPSRLRRKPNPPRHRIWVAQGALLYQGTVLIDAQDLSVPGAPSNLKNHVRSRAMV